MRLPFHYITHLYNKYYKTNYNIISYWVSGYTILSSAISAFMAFDDLDAGFGVASIAEILLSIALIVVNALVI